MVLDRFGYELYEEANPGKLAEKMEGVPWLDPKARNLVDPKTGVRTEHPNINLGGSRLGFLWPEEA